MRITLCLILLVIISIGTASADSTYAPTIAKINPQGGDNTASLNITNLGGTHFLDGAAVSIQPADYPVDLSLAGMLVNGAGSAKLNGAHSVFVQGTTAYVASTNDDALEIIDVSNPASPTHLASIVDGDDEGRVVLDGAWSVYVQGNHAYVVGRDSNALEIVDISTPSSPTHVKSIVNSTGTLLGMPSGIFVTNGSSDPMVRRAYITSTGTNALQIIDVSNPSSPVINDYISNTSGAVGNMTTPRGIFVAGKYAYITSELSHGLEIVDISNQWSAKHAGFIGNGDGGALLANPYSVQVVGNHAYVASYGNNALEIVNVSDPAKPTHTGSVVLSHGNGPMSVAVSGMYAYVASQGGRSLTVIDVSDPAVPVEKDYYYFGDTNGPNGVFVSGDYVYVADNWNKSLDIVSADTGTIRATGENVVSATRINCWFPLTGQPAGVYSVVVENPELKQGVMPEGFVVSEPPGTTTEPFPGWKYHGVLNGTGIYDDGGVRPTGKELWNMSAGIMEESSPAVANGIVYIGDRSNFLYAIYARNGTQKWKKTLIQPVFSTPAVADGIVYIGSGNGENTAGGFYAFNASTGALIWNKTYRGGVDSSPVVYNGTVIVGRDDWNVSAYNAKTGAEIWRFRTADAVRTGIAISRGRAIVVTDDWNIISLDATTGRKVWDFKNSSSFTSFVPESGPAVADGRIYVGGSGGVFMFDEYNGDMLHTFSYDATSFYTTPAVAHGLVYVGTSCGLYGQQNGLWALDADDLTPRWVYNTSENTVILTSPAVANGVVYAVSDRANDNSQGFLYAWNATTGNLIWQYLPVTDGTSGGGTYSGPTVADGVVYFGTWWNGLYAVGTYRGHTESAIGVFRPSTLQFILKDGDNKIKYTWGESGDKPVIGDWNGDSIDDVGVHRPALQKFVLKNGTEKTVVKWGLTTDTGVAGDWNGDGMGDIGVFRSSLQKFVLKNGTEKTIVKWGQTTDKPVSGDWNGDGIDEVGVFRPSAQQFILKNGTVKTTISWGQSTDIPVIGDWNADGMDDVGVFRPSTQQFILKNGMTTETITFGLSTDLPVAGRWI